MGLKHFRLIQRHRRYLCLCNSLVVVYIQHNTHTKLSKNVTGPVLICLGRPPDSDQSAVFLAQPCHKLLDHLDPVGPTAPSPDKLHSDICQHTASRQKGSFVSTFFSVKSPWALPMKGTPLPREMDGIEQSFVSRQAVTPRVLSNYSLFLS